MALFSALKKDHSNCSEDFEGPRERELKNYDTGAFNIKAILDSKPVDSERFDDPLSSCCCEVEDDESNISISQLLQGGSKLNLKSMYEVAAMSQRMQQTNIPAEHQKQRPKI